MNFQITATLGKSGMIGAGRLFGLTPAEWSVLLVSTTLCGCLALFGV
jgi:hypothetical protein